MKTSPRLLICLIVLGVPLLTLGCKADPEARAKQYVASGDEAFAAGRHRDALVQYRNAVEQAPQSVEARQKLGDTYLKLGDGSAALAQYVRVADLLPSDAAAQLRAGQLLLFAGQFDDARARALKALELGPGKAEAHLLLAAASAGLRDMDESVRQMEEAVGLDPTSVGTYTSVGSIALGGGRPEEAEAAFKKAVQLDPRSVDAHLGLAMLYWNARKTDEAEQSLRAALEVSPEDLRANRAMASLCLATGKIREAEPFMKVAAARATSPEGRLGLADYYGAVRRRDEARQLLTELAKDPSLTAGAETRLAALALLDGRVSEAFERVDRVLTKDPSNARALLIKVQALARQGQTDEALALARKAVEYEPGSVTARYALGILLANEGLLPEAAAAFGEAQRLSPRLVGADVQLALVELRRGQFETALSHAESAVRKAPGSREARVVLCRTLIASGDLARAERELAPLLAGGTQGADVNLLRGSLFARARRPDQARDAYRKALAADPASLEALGNLASVELSSGNTDGALALIDQRLAREPRNVGLLWLRARTLLAANRADAAADALRQVIVIDPGQSRAYHLLGQYYISKNRLEEGLREFEEAVEKNGKATGPLTMAGIVSELLNRLDKAEGYYQRALAVDPRAAVASNNLAWLTASRGGNLDVALQLAQAAVEVAPERPEFQDTLSFVYLKKGMASMAIGPARESIAKDPANPQYHFRLGMAYVQMGDKSRARASLEEALALKPDFADAAEARRALAELGKS